MNEVIKGRIGQEGEGFGVRCEIQEDKIVGRAGSRLHGKNIELEITETGVQGKVGDQNITVALEGGELRGTIGDQRLTLRGVDRVTGRFGEPIIGWDIAAQQTGDQLEGRLGSTVLGRPFSMSLAGAPGWVGVLVAVVAFYALEPRASAKAG
ncbi:hypothetical protein Deipr_0318 [Deinococcus proteolyticus MRP]|uniref:Uncharacterized protein n=1 Tax=Deinococcus proteolyticus (strain ATCC 35074 / DSM 20540 / JCM 6276 / NBRC 101906 / NCIMB 13154 / VKM Ac-1939 / CCM 2703 / MRP) TaxID=693977 RepID=F0RJF0_DEIPM|nr:MULTISPECIES: hypothetical protein [Deinococcus]ADY25491.1 hypothetical protein Deipr_0318 [Deinococcus proteolyticus MRP]MCY1701610.1 hypothetical protein [Deinococcus sp. SL84]